MNKLYICIFLTVCNFVYNCGEYCENCLENYCCECWKNKGKVKEFFLEVEEESEERAEIFVSEDWLKVKKNNNNFKLKLLKKIKGGNTENNIKVVKDKDGNLGVVEKQEKLINILGINTDKWALFEIGYNTKEKKEETVYLYCSDIESVKDEKDVNRGIFQNRKNILSISSISVIACNTSGVTDMNNMFYKCSNLTELNISKFNTSNVDNMNWMFYCCDELQQITVSNQAKEKILEQLRKGLFDENKNNNDTWTFTRKK